MELNLNQALAENRLEEFIAQQEARGATVDRPEFESRLSKLIKTPLPEGQTSRSRARDC